MRHYLHSSIALRAILNVPEREQVRAWIDGQPRGSLVSSRLLRIEVVRVLRREGRPPSDGAPILDRVGLVTLGDAISSLAEAIGPTIRTLDTLHMATAQHIGETLTIVTHDATMREVAKALGFATFDPCREGAGTSA